MKLLAAAFKKKMPVEMDMPKKIKSSPKLKKVAKAYKAKKPNMYSYNG